MADVSRETQGFARAEKRWRKVPPRRFAEMWLRGDKRALIAATFDISEDYCSELRRGLGLPARTGGRPSKAGARA